MAFLRSPKIRAFLNVPRICFTFLSQFIPTFYRTCRLLTINLPRFAARRVRSRCYRLWALWREEIQRLSRPEFVYTHLSTRNSIRLLTILPGKPTSPIACTLREYTLDEVPEFVATSYTWNKSRRWPGFLISFIVAVRIWIFIWCEFFTPTLLWIAYDSVVPLAIRTQASNPDPTAISVDRMCSHVVGLLALGLRERQHTIICNGACLLVTENLYDFLCEKRRSQDLANFWIDAVCINQRDIHERNCQILLMPQIYRSALKVCAWLGACPQLLDTQGMMGEAHLPIEEKTMGSLEEILLRFCARYYILSRPYFSRIWVLQEVLHARKLEFLIGSYRKSPDEMRDIVDMTPLAFASVAFWATGGSQELADELLRSRDLYIQRGQLSLSDYLTLASSRRATDQRDLIYAGLGLLPKTSPDEFAHRPASALTFLERPDYSAVPREVFISCAIRLLEEVGFEAFSFAADRTYRVPSTYCSLPSWVPHLTGAARSRLAPATIDKAFTTGGAWRRPGQAVLSTPSGLLVVKKGAFFLDRIRIVHPSNLETLERILLHDVEGGNAKYAVTGESLFTAASRTILGDTFQGKRPTASTARQLLLGYIGDRHKVSMETQRAKEVGVQRLWGISEEAVREFSWNPEWQHRRSRISAALNCSTDSGRSLDRGGAELEQLRRISCEEYECSAQVESCKSESRFSPTVPHSTADTDTNRQRMSIVPPACPEDRKVLPTWLGKSISSADEALHAATGSFLETRRGLSVEECGQRLLSKLNSKPGVYEKELEAKFLNRTFFETENGYLGTGPPGLREGDVVMVLAGARMPYAVQRISSQGHIPRVRLRGELYVHGIMDGELVGTDLWKPDDVEIL